MLDLTQIIRYYQFKWFDGDIVQLPLPTQSMLVEAMNLQNIKDESKQIEGLFNLLKELLKNNMSGKEFSAEDFDELDFYTAQIIMEDYIDYVNKQLGE